MALRRTARLLVAAVAVVLGIAIAAVLVALGRFRDDASLREHLAPAGAAVARVALAVSDEEAALTGPTEAARVDAARSATNAAVDRLTDVVGNANPDPGLAAAHSDQRAADDAWKRQITVLSGTATSSGVRAALSTYVDRQAEAQAARAETATQSRERLITVVVLFAALAVLLLGLGRSVLRRIYVEPVRRLADEVDRLVEGDLRGDISTEGTPELRAVGEAVVTMRDLALSEADAATHAHEALEQEAPAVGAMRDLLAPAHLGRLDGLSTAARFVAAEGVLAGDWFDAFVHEDRLVACIGDVCGHGVEAGSDAVRTKFALIDAIALGATPRAAMKLAERRFGTDDSFVTAVVVEVDPVGQELRYANAGHNPPLVVHADGRVDELAPTGPLIGPIPDSRWTTATLQLAPGDIVLLFTDGLVEGRNAERQQLGSERVVDLLLSSLEQPSLERIADDLLGAARQHSDDGLADDMTFVLIRLDADRAEPEGPPSAERALLLELPVATH
jgi:hypothetical protein